MSETFAAKNWRLQDGREHTHKRRFETHYKYFKERDYIKVSRDPRISRYWHHFSPLLFTSVIYCLMSRAVLKKHQVTPGTLLSLLGGQEIFIKIICWAPLISQIQSTVLHSIFLSTHPYSSWLINRLLIFHEVVEPQNSGKSKPHMKGAANWGASFSSATHGFAAHFTCSHTCSLVACFASPNWRACSQVRSARAHRY